MGEARRPCREARHERAGVDPAEVEDVIMGCAHPEGATGHNIARQIGDPGQVVRSPPRE